MMTLPLRLVQKISNRRRLLLLALVAWYNVANAQQYTWQAPVATPRQTGYQSILLSPEVTGRLRPDFSDLRLYDASGQEVPYLLRAEQPLQHKRLFKNYNILSYTHRKGCCSELLISNPEKRKINNISLLIGNADVRKEVKLSGSDNRKDWYVLKEHDILHAINNRESTAEAKLLDFPLSDYRYFRLQLNDSASAPLNILQAGYYDTHTEAGKYTPVLVQELTRRDSAAAKSTYIRLRFAQPVYPDRLEFTIASPQLYYREGRIQLHPAEPAPRRRSKRRQQQQIVPFILNSNAPTVVSLPRQKIQSLTIIIQNADNHPLEISSIRPLQLNRYMVADLSPKQAYTLRFGDPKASAPTYELQYFRDSIPANLPVLLTKAPEQLRGAGEQKDSTTTSKILIWITIGVVVTGLALMTVRMLNEMNREKRV